MTQRPTWTSRTGFLLAALGSAIGLGNIWRFPYIAYRNGGGAFLIPYFVALFIVGIPLLMLEFGLGHHSRKAFPGALAGIHPRFSWIGWWSVCFVMFGIVAYYAVVIGWCGNYLVFAVTQPWGDPSGVDTFYDEEFLGAFENGQPFALYQADSGLQLGRFSWPVVVSLGFVWLLTWRITRRQLREGIELANKIFIPLLVVLILIMVAWSWGFDGAEQGRSLYLEPDWSRVFTAQTWIDAFTQIFFSLSLAFGIMVAYGSYLPEKTDVPSSAFLAAVGNCSFSVVAAFAVFAAVGTLAQDRGIDLTSAGAVDRELAELEALSRESPPEFAERRERHAELAAQKDARQQFESQMRSFGLVFKTYPAIIAKMGPVAGRIFGVLFFTSLLVAGISSAISIVEAFIAAMNDKFGIDRKRASATLCAAAFGLGLVFCTQAGLFLLDLVDHFITTYGLVLVAICEALIVGWVFTSQRLRSHLDAHRDFRFGPPLMFAMRILITAVLLLTWLGLGQLDGAPLASALGRFLVLAGAVVLWIDAHWLDFDLRLAAPALLIFLLDQALITEIQAPYGGYPMPAVWIGIGWLIGTLVIATVINLLPGRNLASP